MQLSIYCTFLSILGPIWSAQFSIPYHFYIMSHDTFIYYLISMKKSLLFLNFKNFTLMCIFNLLSAMIVLYYFQFFCSTFVEVHFEKLIICSKKFGKKWRNFVFNLLSTNFSMTLGEVNQNPGFRILVLSLAHIPDW